MFDIASTYSHAADLESGFANTVRAFGILFRHGRDNGHA
jgi:hypothetical protein